MTEAVIQDAPVGLDDMGPSEGAPFGWMIDRRTGERRPKKRPGKQAAGGTDVPPDLAGLKDDEPIGEDRAPGVIRRRRLGRRRGRARSAPEREAEPVPPFRAGPIAKGMNRIYARAGKIIKVMDPDVGQAVILSTRKVSDDDVTVGEAWEELAKTNTRIRAILLKVVAGGAWGQLFMAHAPILLAIAMKDAIRKRLPFQRMIEAFLEPADDGTPSELSEQLGGLNPADVAQMMTMAQNLMAGTVNAGRTVNVDRAAGGEPVGE